jgi:hypothetical protein
MLHPTFAIRVPHKESQMIHSTQQLSGSVLRSLPVGGVVVTGIGRPAPAYSQADLYTRRDPACRSLPPLRAMISRRCGSPRCQLYRRVASRRRSPSHLSDRAMFSIAPHSKHFHLLMMVAPLPSGNYRPAPFLRARPRERSGPFSFQRAGASSSMRASGIASLVLTTDEPNGS